MKVNFENNPSINELKKQIEKYKSLISSPLTLSYNKEDIHKIEIELDILEKELNTQIEFSNLYNEIFAERGWIVHESLEVDTIINAVNIYKKDGIALAEEYIEAYYQERFDNLRKTIFNSNYFNSRKRLFELAYNDYVEERYYSCIPLILILVDGVLNDLRQKGFAASNQDYELWDSISGHDSGLNTIATIYNKTRRKTNDNKIELPYRNGILHGRELDYDNKTLAIKTNALVIYIFDWISSYENEEYRKKEFENRNNETFTLKDLENHKAKMKESKKLEKQWNEEKIPEIEYRQEDFDKIPPETPEFELLKFIKNLNEGRYDLNYKYISKSDVGDNTKKYMIGQLRQSYEKFTPIEIHKIYVENRGSASSFITANMKYNSIYTDSETITRDIKFNFIYKDENGDPENRLKKNGKWVIFDILGIKFLMM